MDKELLQEEYKRAIKQLRQAQDTYREIKKQIDSENYKEAVKNYKGKVFCFNNESYYLIRKVIQSENVTYFKGTNVRYQTDDKDFIGFEIEFNCPIGLNTLKESKEITLEEYKKIIIQTTNIVKDEVFDLQNLI